MHRFLEEEPGGFDSKALTTVLYGSGSSGVVCRPAASATPRDILEKQVLGPTPDLWKEN